MATLFDFLPDFGGAAQGLGNLLGSIPTPGEVRARQIEAARAIGANQFQGPPRAPFQGPPTALGVTPNSTSNALRGPRITQEPMLLPTPTQGTQSPISPLRMEPRPLRTQDLTTPLPELPEKRSITSLLSDPSVVQGLLGISQSLLTPTFDSGFTQFGRALGVGGQAIAGVQQRQAEQAQLKELQDAKIREMEDRGKYYRARAITAGSEAEIGDTLTKTDRARRREDFDKSKELLGDLREIRADSDSLFGPGGGSSIAAAFGNVAEFTFGGGTETSDFRKKALRVKAKLVSLINKGKITSMSVANVDARFLLPGGAIGLDEAQKSYDSLIEDIGNELNTRGEILGEAEFGQRTGDSQASSRLQAIRNRK